jgi:hypothetical protein
MVEEEGSSIIRRKTNAEPQQEKLLLFIALPTVYVKVGGEGGAPSSRTQELKKGQSFGESANPPADRYF